MFIDPGLKHFALTSMVVLMGLNMVVFSHKQKPKIHFPKHKIKESHLVFKRGTQYQEGIGVTQDI